MLAECLFAWFPPKNPDDIDTRAAAFVVAETVLILRAVALGFSKKK